MKTLPNIKLKMSLMKKGLTQRDLAFEAGIDESRISKIIRGYEVPTWEIKRDIAKYLGVQEGDIF